jgi:hypothetical protein
MNSVSNFRDAQSISAGFHAAQFLDVLIPFIPSHPLILERAEINFMPVQGFFHARRGALKFLLEAIKASER